MRATWPLAVRAQQPALPVVGFVDGGSPDVSAPLAAAFRKGLNETGNVEGQNVTVEYHWLEGHYDRLPALMADLVRRQVAVIATTGSAPAALAAKAATSTIPIVFGIGEDPVKLGLVASLARPGGNATGINFFFTEVLAKRLRLLHDLVPKAVRIAVLVNPANASTAEPTVREVQEAAPAMGLQIQILNATTIGEIDAAFAIFAREHPDALFVARDAFFTSRRAQFVTLTARERIPATYAAREPVDSRRADELRNRPRGHVSSNRRLYWQNPQGCQARRPAGRAGDQIRVRHQPANGASARHRSSAGTTLDRRRGDRMNLSHCVNCRS